MIDARLWALWGAFVGIAATVAISWFGIMEAIAIKNHIGGDTLSEVVWGKNLPAIVFIASGGVFLGLVTASAIWLVVHFISQGKWGI